MTNERACANEVAHPDFRAMRDSCLEIMQLLDGIDVLAGQLDTLSMPIVAISLRAQSLANGIARDLKEVLE